MRPRACALCGLLLVSSWCQAQASEPHASDDAAEARLERRLNRRPDDPAAHYNLGTIRYHKDDYDGAADALSKALASAEPSLQGRVAYNLGNAHYRQGAARAPASPGEASALYRQALENYRMAIRQNPQDRDAQYNYELAERRLQALKEEQARQASSAPQQPAEGQPSSAQPSAGDSSQQASAQEQQPQSGTLGEEQGTREGAATGGQAQDQSAEGQQGGEQQEASQAGSAGSHAGSPLDEQAMSKQQALWILDTLKREERGALSSDQRGPAHEAPVERDW